MSDKLANEDVASFTEKAYQAILGAIARLELKPGETLTQDRLAKWLAISRTPVREALRRLEQDGLIANVPGRGLIVTELTIKDDFIKGNFMCLILLIKNISYHLIDIPKYS